MLSVNRAAYKLVQKLCDNPDEYRVMVSKTKTGATIIDAGIRAKGGFSAGRIITEICMGGYGKAKVLLKEYGDLELPAISVQTDHPSIATLGSQLAGWQVKIDDFSAIASGPARALALKPREIYDAIGYQDRADTAITVLETSEKPPEEVAEKLASECKVETNKLFVILTPTTSISGSVQISGRVVETGIHKLTNLGLDPNAIEYAFGCAPVAPVHPKFADAMGRTNDVIIYGGVVYCALRCGDDEKLKATVDKASSRASRHYGKPFKIIFKEADNDFYKIDPILFAPAVLVVNNLETGTVLKAGEINLDVLKRSVGLDTR
jgi:methenyltetrahydromethanopterin cyclohydrolase